MHKIAVIYAKKHDNILNYNICGSPFGVTLVGREFTSEKYRYGFNGMEKDDEVKGKGNSYDFGARIYDNRIGRFLTLDNFAVKLSWQSPYLFADNQTINQIDFSGNSGVPTVKVSSTVVKVGSGPWIERDRYDWVISDAPGGGQWFYEKAKNELGASPLGSMIVVAFAFEEGGWGKGNTQNISHNSFSLLQQKNNGIPGTAHGYPMKFDSYQECWDYWVGYLEKNHGEFLKLIKKDKITADDINKYLESGSHHKQGGYTDSDKGAAIKGVLKYTISYTFSKIEEENKSLEEQISNLEKQKEVNKQQSPIFDVGYLIDNYVIDAQIDIIKDKMKENQNEMDKLNKLYDELESENKF